MKLVIGDHTIRCFCLYQSNETLKALSQYRAITSEEKTVSLILSARVKIEFFRKKHGAKNARVGLYNS